jgi:hypothetical protein
MILSARGVGLINEQAFSTSSVTMLFTLEDRGMQPLRRHNQGS